MKSIHGITAADLKSRTRPGKGGCWLWTGNLHESGYPRLSKQGKLYFAHRLMYVLTNGKIPAGLRLWRRCRQSQCINPTHIRAVTQPQIVRLMVAAGAFSHGNKHPGAKLTEADVRQIRRVYAAGKKSLVRLGKEYGVHSTLILRIIQRKRWRHVK